LHFFASVGIDFSSIYRKTYLQSPADFTLLMTDISENVDLYIVIADDDIDDHKLITQAVKECNLNHIVTSVYNGSQLLNLLTKQGFYKSEASRRPDLILLDLKMPILDGFEVLKKIQEDPELSDIPIYTLSDTAFNDDKDRALALGSKKHYAKPLNYEDLRNLIGSICQETYGKRKSHVK
jgi:CheY-like chemotaxis protein